MSELRAVTRVRHSAMWAGLTWVARAIGVVVIGVATFTGKTAHGADLRFEYVMFALCIATTAFWLFTDLRHRDGRRLDLQVTLGLMSALGGVASMSPQGGGFLGFAAMAVLAAGTATEGMPGWVVTAIAVLTAEIGAVIFSASTTRVASFPLFIALAFIAGRNRRSDLVRADQAAVMIGQLEQLRAEQSQVAMLDERTRIAREIHDVLAHSLGALGIQIQTVRAVLEDHGDTERALGLLEQAQRMASDGLVETRRAVEALRGDATRLDRQITDLVGTHRDRHRTDVDLTIDGTPEPLSAEATVALVRTTQEALVNAAKHASHQPIDVLLRYDPEQVGLVIGNVLAGADVAAAADVTPFSSVNGGYGLTGMRERLLLINGTLHTGAADGRWTVSARVPR